MADKFPEQEITPIPVSSFPAIIGNVISPIPERCDSDWQCSYPFLKYPLFPMYLYFCIHNLTSILHHLSDHKTQYTLNYEITIIKFNTCWITNREKINLLKIIYYTLLFIYYILLCEPVIKNSHWFRSREIK